MLGRTLLLTRHDVASLLSLELCTAAVSDAFAAHAQGRTLGTGLLGMHVAGGGFHIKAAGLGGEHPMFAAKVNGNFADNEARFGLPRIQGVIVLFDARHGFPLAVMDSIEITALRTAAATAVAADHLARRDARMVTIVGCGRQSRLQIRAVALVREVERVFACDLDRARAASFAADMSQALRVPVEVVDDVAAAARRSDIIVTCTSALRPVLSVEDVGPGTFVAAVGADSDTKQEIAPALMSASAVVPDLLDQAAAIGDLHHAIAAGVMTREDVRAELGAVVAGLAVGRRSEDETVIFDSTGTALQDVAAARIVYERARRTGNGSAVDLLGLDENPAPAAGPLLRITM